ncbi:hypothetical protein SDC9_144661 [bioreactor metagenome]|uniref:Uncharacterized protein n=1 Tax=bioreactor metagenome TaxID=1076179 RepID=A0A645E8D4_9ZZZZ
MVHLEKLLLEQAGILLVSFVQQQAHRGDRCLDLMHPERVILLLLLLLADALGLEPLVFLRQRADDRVIIPVQPIQRLRQLAREQLGVRMQLAELSPASAIARAVSQHHTHEDEATDTARIAHIDHLLLRKISKKINGTHAEYIEKKRRAARSKIVKQFFHMHLLVSCWCPQTTTRPANTLALCASSRSRQALPPRASFAGG